MTQELPLSVPTVHLNGTSKESLLEDLSEAWHALNGAMNAMRKACPNARDYYVQSERGAFNNAMTQHLKRIATVATVQAEIGQIIIGIDEQ